MNAPVPNEPATRSVESRLITLNAAVCVIGGLSHLVACASSFFPHLRIPYVWVPLSLALAIAFAVSLVLALLGVFAAIRNSFFTIQPQHAFTRLRRFSAGSCVSVLPTAALFAGVYLVGNVAKSLFQRFG